MTAAQAVQAKPKPKAKKDKDAKGVKPKESAKAGPWFSDSGYT